MSNGETLGSAGSLEPINPDKGKWTDGLASADLESLQALATDINKAVDLTVKQVARGKIRVGKLLLEARSLFNQDQAFGLWRKEHTMVQSKQHAHYLMQVADKFGDAPKLIEGANYSVLQELVLAEQEEIEWVQGQIDKGDPPTVAEVRKKVTAAKPVIHQKGQTVTQPALSPHEDINELVGLGLTMRIKLVVERGIKGIEGDLIILGMDPDPQIPCHPDSLGAIVDYWLDNAQSNDEERALKDSYQRVVAEFKGWKDA